MNYENGLTKLAKYVAEYFERTQDSQLRENFDLQKFRLRRALNDINQFSSNEKLDSELNKVILQLNVITRQLNIGMTFDDLCVQIDVPIHPTDVNEKTSVKKSTHFDKPPFFTKGHALIVGVGNDLPCTIDDAKGLAKILRDEERCAYNPEQVHLLTGERADRDGLFSALDTLAKATDNESTVIIYFSGHGRQHGKSYYLMTNGYNTNDLDGTAISGAEFADKIMAIPAQKKLVLLDCCHAGGIGRIKGKPLTKSPLPPEAVDLFSEGEGYVLIASSKKEEYSLAGNPYSVFTGVLIEALCGKGVAEKDGYVRVADLAGHTREKVPKLTKGEQHPILHFEKADNFVIAYYAAGDMQPKAVPFSLEAKNTEADSSFDDVEKALIEKRLANLIQQYKAVFNQRELALDDGYKVVLTSQLEHLKTQIQQIESELNQL
jgi:hypothetical protein